jgi:hypothetical protein
MLAVAGVTLPSSRSHPTGAQTFRTTASNADCCGCCPSLVYKCLLDKRWTPKPLDTVHPAEKIGAMVYGGCMITASSLVDAQFSALAAGGRLHKTWALVYGMRFGVGAERGRTRSRPSA